MTASLQHWNCTRPLTAIACIVGPLFSAAGASAGTLSIASISPSANALTAPPHTPIVVTFDRPVDPATVTPASFSAFGRSSGLMAAVFEFSDNDQTVTLRPSRHWSCGELVTLTLSRDLVAEDGSPFRPQGHQHQFWIAARPAAMAYVTLATMTTRTIPTQGTRAYGGVASDLNNDGYLDLTVINEDSADLRVFMNLADRTGAFAPFIQPPFPVGNRASPSEAADFNRDGNVDICVANINVSTVSILLGDGAGNYGPQQLVNVGVSPRGIAVLDADGDGDWDIANTNASSNNMSLMLNNGSGIFGPATFFEGGNGEYALGAADMNLDGILDLVIGARGANQIRVSAGNGNGTYSPLSFQNAGGAVWMLALGDLSGDGLVDVANANSTSNNGSILLGTGGGQLGPPQVYATDAFPLASDVGDLDGDGDLDWITSSYNGDWQVRTNNGNGTFTFLGEFNAPQAASCSVIFDFDNDGDLDLALIDEEADVVIFVRNGGVGPCVGLGDFNVNGRCDGEDVGLFVDTLLQTGNWTPMQLCRGDFTGNGAVGPEDVAPFVACALAP